MTDFIKLSNGDLLYKWYGKYAPNFCLLTKQEAIATNLLNQAMKGDIRACQYIQNIQMTAKIMKKK